jgi:hypothetical protein
VSAIEQKETCEFEMPTSENLLTPNLHRILKLSASNVREDGRSLLFFAFFHSGIMDNMAIDAMFNMPGGDDFRHVTSVFSNAARG